MTLVAAFVRSAVWVPGPPLWGWPVELLHWLEVLAGGVVLAIGLTTLLRHLARL